MTEIQIKQTIGQLEASINKVEKFTNEEEFKEYCDNIQTCITYWRTILKKIKENEK
jgi:hypothetical protein